MKKLTKLLFSGILAIALVPAFVASLSKDHRVIETKADDPVVCSSFTEFKAAMEDESISTVKLTNIVRNSDESLIVMGPGNTYEFAIEVPHCYKTLILDGDAYFYADPTYRKGTLNCAGLIENKGFLKIVGNGSLTFGAVMSNVRYNSAIYNLRELTLGSPDKDFIEIKSEPYLATYTMAVVQENYTSKLTVYDGASIISQSGYQHATETDFGAVQIRGGHFKMYGGDIMYNLTNNAYEEGYYSVVYELGDLIYDNILEGNFNRGIKFGDPSFVNTVFKSETRIYDACNEITSNYEQFIKVRPYFKGFTSQPKDTQVSLGQACRVDYAFDIEPTYVNLYELRNDLWYPRTGDEIHKTYAIINGPEEGGYSVNGLAEFKIVAKFYTDQYEKEYESKPFVIYWEQLSIEFNANGGSGSMQSQAIYSTGQNYILPPCGFTAPIGKVFAGWDIDGVIKSPGTQVTFYKNTTIKATWKKAEYKFTSSPVSGTVAVGQTYQISWTGIFPITGYFEIYEKKGGGNELIGTIKTDEEYLFTIPASDIDLPKTFEISLYEGLVGEGTFKKTCDPFTVTWTNGAITTKVIRYKNSMSGYIEEEHNLGDEVIIKGYPHDDIPLGEAFEYWEDDESNRYEIGDKIVLNKSLVLTPNFFNGFNVSFSDATHEILVENIGNGYEIVVPEYEFDAPNGQYFSHWHLDISAVESYDYLPGEKMTVYADQELEAVFYEYKYTVWYNANGGTGTMEPDHEAGLNYEVKENQFTAPDNYEFDGFAKDSPSGDKVTGIIDIDSDTILYATWVAKKYNLTYSAGYAGPSNLVFSNLEGGSSVTLLSQYAFKAPEGKVFLCWAVNSVDGVKVEAGSEYVLNGDITLIAIWGDEVIQHSVNFSANGGTGEMLSGFSTHGVQYKLPGCGFAAPEGKEFDAWEVNSERKNPGDSITVNEDVTVKALWKDKTPEGGGETPVTPDPGTPTTPEQPAAKKGLSGGAVAGIVIGSVVVVGLGGFAVFWFVIKKKTFADLVAIFKKK